MPIYTLRYFSLVYLVVPILMSLTIPMLNKGMSRALKLHDCEDTTLCILIFWMMVNDNRIRSFLSDTPSSLSVTVIAIP